MSQEYKKMCVCASRLFERERVETQKRARFVKKDKICVYKKCKLMYN